MAIFGAPITHENDPERAIRCATEMLSYIGRFNTLTPIPLPQPLGIHIGINSGIVVAGNVGSDLRMNYSVIGDTVNLAARLVSQAKSGMVFISESTYNSVHHLAKISDPEMITLKGKSEPVKVYSILGIDDSYVPGERILRTSAFVGRTKELDTFKECISSLSRKSESRLFVCGEAGVGKSRLKLEFHKLSTQSTITVYEGKCSSFETTTPYYLWNTLVKSILGVERETPEHEIRGRLHDFLQILGIGQHEPYLATLLSLRYEQILFEEDDLRKNKIYESVTMLLRTLSARKQIMIVFEDLHWADKFSDTLLQYVFREGSIAPVIFVFLYRPEYQRSVTLRGKGGIFIDLNRLGFEEASQLIHSRFEVKVVPQQIKELIYQRSMGNPFFTEEIIRTMLDRKNVEKKGDVLVIKDTNLSELIPDTVQGIIMARIDRLEERIKDVLFQASVIGREFSRPVLEKVAGNITDLHSTLEKLNTLELILPKEEAMELEYLFKHYLIQEVAYNTLLIKKRKELHARIAQAIEVLYPDQLRDFYELLSFHYERAEQWDKAAEYLSRSGRKVKEIFSKEESQNFEERTQTAIDKLFESASANRLGLSVVGWIVMIIAVPIAAMGFVLPASFMVILHEMPNEFIFIVFGYGWEARIRMFLYCISVWTFFPWFGLTFFFWGILPFFRPKPKVFDITGESVRIGFSNGKLMNFHFSTLEEIIFIDPVQKKKRTWWQMIFDPFYRHPELVGVPFRKSIWPIFVFNFPIYTFGFESSKGAVRIKKKRGYDALRLLFPWLNVPSLSRFASLAASAPQEFAEQANTAFEKWKRKTADSTKEVQ